MQGGKEVRACHQFLCWVCMLEMEWQRLLYSKCVDEPLHLNVKNMDGSFIIFMSLQLSNRASNTNESEDTFTWTNAKTKQHIWGTF